MSAEPILPWHGAQPHRIAVVTDAWAPQMNGVVRTMTATCDMLRRWGHEVLVIAPDQFRSLPCPTYPEIRLALPGRGSIAARLDRFAPDAIHIATEGPLGLAARRYCRRRQIAFTTAYHTQFPAYLARRTHLPEGLFWRYIRWFHRPAERVMVATASIRAELAAHGLERVHHWSRGVDLASFSPGTPPPSEYAGLAHPIQLYVGRVAVEKNVEAFLASSHPGSKVVVGDGPALADLQARYPQALYLGRQSGAALAGCYAGADVFVFPSRTDTFGLVMIEAMACGLPVAAFPVPGPIDLIDDNTGAVSEEIERAIDAALFCNRKDCLAMAQGFSWEAATAQFLEGLQPLVSEEQTFAALAH